MFSARNMLFAGSFSPLQYSPALWLDASDAATLLDAGGDPASADEAIATWSDKSGNGRKATKGTAGSRPLRKTAIQNGKAVLRFDGGDDWLATSAFGGTETWTRFVVVANASQSQYDSFLTWGNAYDSPNPGADYSAFNAGLFEWAQNGGAVTTYLSIRQSISNFPDGQFNILGRSTDGTHAGNICYQNGVLLSNNSLFSANPGSFSKAATSIGIGAFNDGVSPAACDIAEIIHYPTALGTTEREAVEAYLNTKWAIY